MRFGFGWEKDGSDRRGMWGRGRAVRRHSPVFLASFNTAERQDDG